MYRFMILYKPTNHNPPKTTTILARTPPSFLRNPKPTRSLVMSRKKERRGAPGRVVWYNEMVFNVVKNGKSYSSPT